MEKDSSQKKEKKKPNVLWFLVVIAISAISGLMEDGRGSSRLLLIIVLGVVVLAGVVAVIAVAAKKAGAQTPYQRNAPNAAPKRERVNARYAPPVFSRATVKQDNCGYDAANCNFSHDYQRRCEQLDGFLKNGIIDKNEYNVLMAKYEKSGSIQ